MFPACARIKKSSSGFTLVELLVVIGIIGILIAATLSVIPKVQRAVYGTQTSAELSTIANAIQQYYNDFKAYPGPLPNTQLNSAYDGSVPPGIPGPSGWLPLVGGTPPAGFAATASALGFTASTHITGSENLVLGLCGGLMVNSVASPNVLEYHPEYLFALDGVTPLAHGPASLNINNPRKQQPYIDLKKGMISIPNNTTNLGVFTDSAGRYGTDSIIPEFMDQYSDPLPILYYRTNIGGTAIAGKRQYSSTNGNYYVDDSTTQLTDNNGNPVIPQYDIAGNLAYTSSIIGTKNNTMSSPGANPNSIHGLQGLGNANLTDPIDASVGSYFVPSNAGKNGFSYFKDPSLNSANSTNTSQGTARQKDGFILISAGPDRQYGTRDDVIYPGPLLP